MNLSRTPKILIGLATAILTLSPILFIVFFFAPMGIFFAAGGQEPDPSIMLVPLLIFPFMLLVIVLQFGLMIFYIAHIVMNKPASELVLIILAVGMYFMPFLAMPVYYFIYVLPERPPDWALMTTKA